MRYHSPSRGFKTKDWRALWRSNIENFDKLKEKSTSNSAFVAIDAEGWHVDKDRLDVSEIGIAVLPPLVSEDAKGPDTDFELDSLFSRHSIQGYSFRIRERERRERDRESFRFGDVQHVEPEEMETRLVGTLESISRQFGNLILVGFDLSFEFGLIASKLTQITPFFSSWIDLQEITTEVSGTQSPSMTDTLLALGLPLDGVSVRRKSSQHSAGNDAVRELAVLLKLLTLPGGNTSLQIHQEPSKSRRHGNAKNPGLHMYWNDRRPRPKELYPFVATIRIEGASVARKFQNLTHLRRIFKSYEPTAVGTSKNSGYGWICLASAEVLARFVMDVQGQELGGVVWNVTTDYDPEQSPSVAMTPYQLREARRAEQHAQKENKRLQRRSKGRQWDEDDEDSLGLDLDLEGIASETAPI